MMKHHCLMNGAWPCDCNDNPQKGDKLSPMHQVVNVNPPKSPEESPFKVVNPLIDALSTVKLTSKNLADVAFYVLHQGEGGVEIPVDQSSFTWRSAGRTVRFDVGHWIVHEWDNSSHHDVFRNATEAEVKTYGLGRQK